MVGSYNSGTTLFHRILSLHPDIGTMPKEGRNFTNELPNAVDFGIPRLWALKPELFYMDEKSGKQIDVDKIKRQWAFFYNDAGKPLLIDKSIVNAARTRWLQEHFENAHFIILMRNGYAVAEGIRRKAGHDIEKAILQWKNGYEILLKDMPFLKNKIYVKYEELTADPRKVLDLVCDFLNISHLPQNVFDAEFKVHERSDKITDFNKKSIDSLSTGDLEIINRIAGNLLKQTGYELVSR